jgi:predicted TIM-barrel fold metal-dependent hydrolase
MIVDFQHHYTPPELLKSGAGGETLRLDDRGNPDYRFNPLLSDLPAHLRMMDVAGIDIAVLSCGSGCDQPDMGVCRLINDRMMQAQREHAGRFIGLAHVPALDASATISELKRCAVDLGFPGVVIASEVQGLALDAPELRPFWKAAADLGLYVFVHPLPRVIDWVRMDADDLGRMLGWEFSLIVATVRLINSGLLDDFPHLNILMSHFGGGVGRFLPRILGLQDRRASGTASIARHGREPQKPFEHYLNERLYFDCAGWCGPGDAAGRGSEWMRRGLGEIPHSQVLFATDYPQAERVDEEIASYVNAIRALDGGAERVLEGCNVEKLIPALRRSS